MTKPDPTSKLTPPQQAAMQARQECDHAWLRLKEACTSWGVEWEYVDAIEQRAKIHLTTGKVLKVWRHGEAFRLALGDAVLGTFQAANLLAASLTVIRQ